jgi:hypothetical protein
MLHRICRVHDMMLSCSTQGCSTLESLVGQQLVEVKGIIVEAQTDISDAIETQQVEGEATQQGEEAEVSPNATGILGLTPIPFNGT